MAKIKYSALVSDMRNKLNGSVLSKNRYGSYVRNKVTPVNPQTAYQQAVRQRLGSLSAAWRNLSQPQRLAWSETSKSAPFTDIFGDTKVLDGKAFFVKLNSNLLSIGEDVLTNAPALQDFPSIAITGASVQTDGTVSISLSETTIPVGFALKVFATPALPAQINFVKNRLRELSAPAAVAAGTATLTTAYASRFAAPGDADELKRVFFRAVLVSTISGQQGVPTEFVATVEAV